MRAYHYVGPPELLAAVPPGALGRPVAAPEDLEAWLAAADPAERHEPFTYVIDLAGVLRLAPRRSEHVACAGAAPVLGAGEITFALLDGAWRVTEISNQSTGYCPDVVSWPAVQGALDRSGLGHPGHFTWPIVFRRCPRCDERTIVKDGHFACAFCDEELPEAWNIEGPVRPGASGSGKTGVS